MLIPVIRYGAQRAVELSESEQREIDRILEEFAVVEQVDAEPKDGPNWEAFNVEPQDELKGTGFILRGGTWLPNNSGGHMWQGYVHWCKALTEIRRTLNDATWYVAVDDDEVEWNAASQQYIADPYAAFLVADPIEVAMAFAARMNQAGYAFDFSFASLLSEVDKVIRSDLMPPDPRRRSVSLRCPWLLKSSLWLWQILRRASPNSNRSEKEKLRNEAALSAYVGEVIRREYNGQWTGWFCFNCPHDRHSLVIFDGDVAPFSAPPYINLSRELQLSFRDVVPVIVERFNAR